MPNIPQGTNVGEGFQFEPAAPTGLPFQRWLSGEGGFPGS